MKTAFHSEQSYENIPVIVNLGNHDIYPDSELSVEQDDSKRRSWCTRLATSSALWGDWVANATNADAEHFNDGKSSSDLNFSNYR